MLIKMIKSYLPKFIEGTTYKVNPYVGLKLVEDGHAVLLDVCGPIPDRITK